MQGSAYFREPPRPYAGVMFASKSWSPQSRRSELAPLRPSENWPRMTATGASHCSGSSQLLPSKTLIRGRAFPPRLPFWPASARRPASLSWLQRGFTKSGDAPLRANDACGNRVLSDTPVRRRPHSDFSPNDCSW